MELRSTVSEITSKYLGTCVSVELFFQPQRAKRMSTVYRNVIPALLGTRRTYTRTHTLHTPCRQGIGYTVYIVARGRK